MVINKKRTPIPMLPVYNYEKELNRQRELNYIYTKYAIVQFKTIDLIQNISFSNENKKNKDIKNFNRIKKHIIKYDNDMIIFKKRNNRY